MPQPAVPTAAFDAPRAPWRGLALLTAAVVAAHLALLDLAPLGSGPQPSPLEARFETRTIVIAPPPSEPPAPAPPVATPPTPATTARPPAARHARTAAPQAAPTPEARPAAATDPDARDLIAESAIDAAPAPPAAPQAAAPEAAPPAAADTGGNLPGEAPLRIPGSVRLAFEVSGQKGSSPMKGGYGDLVWLQDGRKYDAQLSLKVLFWTARTQRSTGTIGATGIEPERFSETRKVEQASHFVRDQRTIVFSSNAPSVPLMAGAQDRLSVVLQLGALLAGDPGRYAPGSVIAVQTVGIRDGEIWTFNVDAEETLNLPTGTISAVRLTRNPRKPFDDKVELWLAPSLGYLPVRLKWTQAEGDFADMQLRNVQSLGPKS